MAISKVADPKQFGLNEKPFVSYNCDVETQMKMQINLYQTGDNSTCWPVTSLCIFSKHRIYLHFLSFLDHGMTQVAEIRPHRRHPVYPTWSIQWMLISWRRKYPSQLKPLYWFIAPGMFWKLEIIVYDAIAILVIILFTSSWWLMSWRQIGASPSSTKLWLQFQTFTQCDVQDYIQNSSREVRIPIVA